MTVTAASTSRKLSGYDLYRALGSPKTVVAPMVDQSELAWRTLARRYNADLAYTPMINAKIFIQPKLKQSAKDSQYDLTHGEEGSTVDRPLVAQFCAHDPVALLAGAKAIEHTVDAVDINLGCPQEIARKGRYGAFLMDDWPLIHSLISTLHEGLNVPVTAKFRVFETVEKTVEYAKMLESAGAQILTCHGRLREQRGQNTGLADWAKIRAVKEAVKVPVFANGNILYHADLAACLQATGADAVMSAEGQLYNAAIFAPARSLDPLPSLPSSSAPADVGSSSTSSSAETPLDPGYLEDLASLSTGLQPRHATLALEYLAITRLQSTHTASSAVKGHLFKLLRPALARETDLRDRLGRCQGALFASSRYLLDEKLPAPHEPLDIDYLWPEESQSCAFADFAGVCREMRVRMERDERAAARAWAVAVAQEDGRIPDDEGLTSAHRALGAYTDQRTGVRVLPHWLAQPYVRPPRPERGKAELAAEAASLAKKAARAEAAGKVAQSEEARVGEKRASAAIEVALGEDESKRVRLGAPAEGDVYG